VLEDARHVGIGRRGSERRTIESEPPVADLSRPRVDRIACPENVRRVLSVERRGVYAGYGNNHGDQTPS